MPILRPLMALQAIPRARLIPIPITPILARPASSGPPRSRQTQPAAHPLSYRDSSIPHSVVRLIGPEGLLPPQRLSSILSTYSTSTHTLTLVSVDAEERDREKEKEEKSKVKRKISMEEKEVQVSWQSAKGDLGHKLEMAKGILEKGDRVQVVFANRRRAEAVNERQKEEIVAMFEGTLEEVGKKWKEDDKNRGLWVLYYNPLDSVRQEVEKKVLEAERVKKEEKEKAKQEKLEARRKKEERRRQRAEEMEKEKAEEAARREEEYQRRIANSRKSGFGGWR
ncbi:hypothetical protein J008_03229 [Cryptococcus neoformans]|uniref:Translation initiation factor 3 N-terminal domain-containing protein n=2 Tax=Cryptococcus neoformans TaxID=5207 RepID=A0A854QD15_CRYNE|nr:hypothetical protein CNAG_02471 [Cryptococcus neoformans var. grubii H99]AUB25161.1 hypothetical protein CKF44_02471 [Cryptococcus neoformans var. grubii]OWT39263.1 hypothetical protein C362_02853 [Cryptococcus neoformans var. grubii Bt1]OWZ31436.1 hypothetical protein C347_03524 [Cryptococcus neoformans var. grubii AD2-60a]OWZ42566.1 hypothetical protein C353_03367 [Cryptococcus neoformans var. grubii AD1-83a]OWZ43597.1 hypothetical protein C343_03461 [Cryptococcus neoformans var. grubii C|eukprot:XP_012050164.1 hypothetical protein CNAG_02471 [Cryptococcus neoformans var. grubii H99]